MKGTVKRKLSRLLSFETYATDISPVRCYKSSSLNMTDKGRGEGFLTAAEVNQKRALQVLMIDENGVNARTT